MTQHGLQDGSDFISIVVPAYNEEGNVEPLYRAVRRVFDELWYDFELIFVDDGSTDRTAEKVRQLHDRDGRVKLVSFARNFGHQMAITAGMQHAGGEAVVTLDADLQHPPELIQQMVAFWNEGYDVVYTIRKDTEGAGLLKQFLAKRFYSLINRMADTRIVENAADFRLLDRKVVACLNAMPERSRFIRGLVAWVGFNQTSVSYVAGARLSGQTKYSFRKMLSFAAAGITSFSRFPLRMATYLGFAAAFAGLPYAVWAVYVKLFTDSAEHGWASLIVAILFLGGIQLVCLGVLGEYVGRIYEEVKGRPLYVARERVGFQSREENRWHGSVRTEPAEPALPQPAGSHGEAATAR